MNTHRSGPGHAALRRGRTSIPGQVYHLTTTTADRRPYFADFHLARLVVPCLYDSALIGNSQTLCWVLMPDHLHWLLALGDNTELSRVVGRFKSASAARINLALDRVGVPVWARAYHDHAVRHDEDVETVARYIVGNPLRAGLREDIGHYPHWDAAWDWAW